MKSASHSQKGLSLIELMIAISLGILLVGVVVSAYVAQSQVYKASQGQAAIQDADNAIAGLVGPTVRAAGFVGCSSISGAASNLVPGGSPPLGNLANVSTGVMGYDASNTAGDGSTLSIATDNANNDADPSHWSPSLDVQLAGHVLPGSDVLVVLGAVAGSAPTALTSGAGVAAGPLQVKDASAMAPGQFAAISDCGKSTIFLNTGATISQTTIARDAGAAALTNAAATFPVNYGVGAQVIPLSQTAFFVSHTDADQSALMRATLTTTGWNIEQLVPGVESMQVLYGSNANFVIAQYVPAGAVTDWTAVSSVRLSFLIEGRAGSGTGAAASPFMLLGTAVTPPADTRLRHVYEMTINLRNATS
ncbi:Tfp pilus assembly protein PilW [Variovorax sp. SRS16]|uniref:PilW family protein n=1 Tax=Variovorax sp. SRS16 TaxID=282217 RepID=UPI001317C47C|nr:PilW family protein [Variovorax sp. SRS16]VTU15230.1 Tfp pilus assembly protein PilW [Variovorax sp. SRS16]